MKGKRFSNKKARKRTVKPAAASQRTEKTGSVLNTTTLQIPTETDFGDHSAEHVTRLELVCPKQPLRSFPILEDEIIIGRDSDCKICLPFVNVSRIHAHIIRKGEDLVVEDLNSTNGTYVNNIRIEKCILHDHDQIRIGDAKIFFYRQKIPGIR